jgi:hypothetical protein
MGHLQQLVESANSEIKSLQESISERYAIFQKRSVYQVGDLVLSESMINDTQELRCIDKLLEATLLEMELRDLYLILEDEDAAKEQYDREMDAFGILANRSLSGEKAKRAKEVFQNITDRISFLQSKIPEIEERIEDLETKKKHLYMQIQRHNSAKGGASTKLRGERYADIVDTDENKMSAVKISPETLDKHWNPK